MAGLADNPLVWPWLIGVAAQGLVMMGSVLPEQAVVPLCQHPATGRCWKRGMFQFMQQGGFFLLDAFFQFAGDIDCRIAG
ncbi:MAG: hypothetical protein R3E89_06560 [Thiolinea sp.]